MKKLFEELCEDYSHNFIPRKEIKASPKIEELMELLNLKEFNSQTKLNPALFFYFRLLFFGTFERDFLNENDMVAENLLRNFKVEEFSSNQMGERIIFLLRLEFVPDMISRLNLCEAFSSTGNWDSETAIKAYKEFKKRNPA